MDKTINYCWFGGNKKPAIIEKCIKSWEKYCSDYKIVEWNESNFDITCCKYVKEAYDNKKYAFVSDYARFYVLNKYGGVYLDTDVELLKPLDIFLTNNFVGFENANSVATGLIMACEKDNELCKYMIEQYNKDRFILEDGTLNLKTVCVRVTDYFVKKGLVLEDRTQNINGYIIYNSSYFNPKNNDASVVELKENTVSIHHYAATWTTKNERFRGKVYNVLCRLFGKNFAEKIRKILGRK